jgi:hypothetical protein
MITLRVSLFAGRSGKVVESIIFEKSARAP